MERLRRSENRMAGPAASDPPVRPVHASFFGVALARGPDEHRRHGTPLIPGQARLPIESPTDPA